jgi:nucleoside-diphosphate-sugar epimerase
VGLHVVLGKGAVGTALARRLIDAGNDVRVLSRSGGTTVDGADSRAVDAADPRALTGATTGAEALYNCANPAYHRWASDWPPIAAALLTAAEHSGAVLVTTSNLYPYGEVDAPMTERTPATSTGVKGRVRAKMWTDAVAAHEAGRVRVSEARAADYIGPGVTDQGHMAGRVVPRVLAGKAVRVMGNPDVAHSFTAVDDVARTLMTLAGDERAWGRFWHVPSAPAHTQREVVRDLCRAAGVAEVPVKTVSPAVLRLMGVFSPPIRELSETAHQLQRPFVIDASAAERTFELHPTPWPDTISATVDWWRDREAHAA